MRVEEHADRARKACRERFEIFARAVHDDDACRIGERIAERVERDVGERIDERDALAERELDQRESREERRDAHELRVEPERRRRVRHEFEQRLGAIDPVGQGESFRGEFGGAARLRRKRPIA